MIVKKSEGISRKRKEKKTNLKSGAQIQVLVHLFLTLLLASPCDIATHVFTYLTP
jgi:hypothetical protein